MGASNFPRRKISSYSVLNEAKHNLLPLKCDLHRVAPFQGTQCRKSGEMSNSTAQKPDQHRLFQVIKANILSDKSG